LKNHERLCRENPSRQASNLQSFFEKGHSGVNQYTKAEKLHKAKPTYPKRSLAPRTKEYKQAQSLRLKQARLEGKDVGGIRHGAGRGRKGYYNGIWCDSTWELAFVVWCIDHKKDIKRNTRYFMYSYNTEVHKYFPDFVVDGKLVEIKAYVNEQAKTKLQQCSEPIDLITYGTIEPYLEYARQKCGSSDLTQLYN